jgi:hypothetical protein
MSREHETEIHRDNGQILSVMVELFAAEPENGSPETWTIWSEDGELTDAEESEALDRVADDLQERDTDYRV